MLVTQLLRCTWVVVAAIVIASCPSGAFSFPEVILGLIMGGALSNAVDAVRGHPVRERRRWRDHRA